MAVVLTVLFIAAVVVLNVIVSIISDRIDTTADLTDTGIYTLDEATTNYLAGLDKDVTVSVMNTESSFEGGSSFYKSVNELLNKMAMENEHFKLQYLKIDQSGFHLQIQRRDAFRELYRGGVQGYQPPPHNHSRRVLLLPDVPR